MDPFSIVADEVALEGLDGITIPSLWIRLENRQPKFPLKLDEPTKELLWRSLVNNPDLKYYQNPHERDDVVLFDRFEDIDPETGIEITRSFSETLKDIYPIHIIENINGIQGSCPFFTQRRDVTKNIRSKSLTPLLNLQEALERYGRKLVVVASQKVRFRTLIGSESDPDLKINDDSYCVLERVGRARWQGELQKDLHGHSFKIDARKLHYLRLCLVKHGLVTMQSHCTRLKTGQQQHSILLLLKRFHVNRRSKYDILMEYVSNFLQESSDQVVSLITLKAQMNVNDGTLKRVIQYMKSAKLVEIYQYPLEDLNPSAGPCVYKKGNKVLVRCLRLLKPYTKKGVNDDDVVDDEDDEDDTEAGRAPPPEGRLMEHDMLSQAYRLVLSCGTKGIPQSGIGFRMNVGKLESRMICRRLEREGVIKGFMEDQGRQRTTKFISHKCVGVSNELQLFVKEQERNKLLYSSDPQSSSTAPSTSKLVVKDNDRTPAAKRKRNAEERRGGKDVVDAAWVCGERKVEAVDEISDGEGGKTKRKESTKNTAGKRRTKKTQAENPIVQPDEGEALHGSKSTCATPDPAEQAAAVREDGSTSSLARPLPQNDIFIAPLTPDNNSLEEVKPDFKLPRSERPSERSHETYRLLRRKNLIVEAVRNFKIVEGLFPLQKMINDEEKLGGFSTKCCKKTILRLVHSLSREGLLKFYRTTVIQDGITKKAELIVHPSVQPSDDIVTRAIDQIRFKISSSYRTVRLQHAEEKAKEKLSDKMTGGSPKSLKSKADKKRESDHEDEFKPVAVRGFGKKLGFLPKMPRLRVIHTFLWYLIYGHPQKCVSTSQPPYNSESADGSVDPESPDSTSLNLDVPPSLDEGEGLKDDSKSGHSESDLKGERASRCEQSGPESADGSFDPESAGSTSPNLDVTSSLNEGEGLKDDSKSGHSESDLKGERASRCEQSGPESADGSFDPESADSTLLNLDVTSSLDEGEGLKDKSKSGLSESDLKVYVDEDSWKRFVPPVHLHKDFGQGWAMIGDVLLCLPLSVFIQFTQINYQVDDLEEYLNDPVKQHCLVRLLPARMKRQLLYRRKYIFSFHENLQKLVYMGLVQFGPMEKFKEKDQAILYLKRNATIVDTTSAEPHYWLVTESADKPFERRHYTFSNAEDVENYWFDLMCVCLNTPLGVVRIKRNATAEEVDPSFVHERNVFVGLAYMLKGSRDVCDDGSTPGDGKGAGGLDSEFFCHLKRNWFWTNHLLACKTRQSAVGSRENTIRLKSLLSKNAFRFALKAAGSATPRYVTAKRPLLTEKIQLDIEPASRNQQVVGGKGQKRKRSKKEVVKAPRKRRREPKKRTPAHDEVDHRALKMMTRQRVTWSVQEDSLMMLCRVASHLLNSKLKRPFIPYCVVRDLLHAEFEMSMDKTSVAVGRRTRYILKNPQTLLNYRISLAEVYQDKPLLKLLEENKPADPENVEDCAKVFSEHVRLLRQKFSTALTPCDIIIPDTKHQLFARFRVLAIHSGRQTPCRDSINCTEDIHTIVLDNLIQSTLAMNNTQMKSSRSFQTFQLYSKYDQELLCKVFLQCRKRGLVNRRRVNQPFGPKKNRALPILPMSYQLSQSYYRCFSTRFPHSLFTDSFRLLRSLINNRICDDRPVTMFHNETVNKSENGEELVERRKETENKKNQKSSADGVRAEGEHEIRPEMMIDDPSKEGETKQKVEGEQKNPGHCFTPDSEDPPRTDVPTAASSTATPQPPEEPPDVSDMLPFNLNSLGGECVVSLSLISLGLLNIYISIPKHIVVVDSNLVDKETVKRMATLEDEDDDDDEVEESEKRKKMEVTAHQASHTKYLMMRGYCSPGIVKQRDINTTDSIVVESCIIKLQLRNTPAHYLLPKENLPLDLTKCGPALLPSSLSSSIHSSSVMECEERLIRQKGYTPRDIDACSQLRRSLDAASEIGLDIRDLYQRHVHLEEPQSERTRSLQQYMKDLEEEGQVVQVGSLGARWVLMRHADNWLLTLQSKQWVHSNPTSDKRKNQSITHKRCRRGADLETEEPRAKRSAVDKQEDEDRKDAGKAGEKVGEEKQMECKEREGDGNDDKLLNLEEEGGQQMQPEEQAGQGKVETEEGQEKNESETREVNETEERGSPTTEPAAVDDVSDPNRGNVCFISRPWRMVDSSLNRSVCKGMLEGVLCHIMSRPGITQQTLVEHYKAVLQPMALLDLVQVLIDMGCVLKKTLVKTRKPSLFSRSPGSAQLTSEKLQYIEEPDTVFYEPTVSCCLRLSQVLPNERHWNYCLK